MMERGRGENRREDPSREERRREEQRRGEQRREARRFGYSFASVLLSAPSQCCSAESLF